MTGVQCVDTEVTECSLEEVVLGAVLEQVGLETGRGDALVDLDCFLIVLQLCRELRNLPKKWLKILPTSFF